MRLRTVVILFLALVSFSLIAFVGCGGRLGSCSVSPIDIEETRSDARDLDKDLAAVRERLKVAEGDLAKWQARLEKRRAELPALEAELARLQASSGVTREVVAKVETKPRTEDEIQVVPKRD